MTNKCSACQKPIAHDNFISACEQLENEGHPVPMIQCECGDRIWRLGRFSKCAGCGREKTGHLALVGRNDPSWEAKCKTAQDRLDELLGRSREIEYCGCPLTGKPIFEGQ